MAIKEEKWEVSKHGTPDYAPQYGIHNGGASDFCIVKGENAEAIAHFIAAAPKTKKQLDNLLIACTNLVNCLSENTDDYPDYEYYRIVMRKMEHASHAIAEAE